MQAINRVEKAIAALKDGQMVILTDHPDREDEGDLMFPAELTTPEKLNFMRIYTSGIICIALTRQQLNRLNIPAMVPNDINGSRNHTPFTVSIEARHGVSSGVSTQDRAKTILTAVSDTAKPSDIVKPGHVFPLQANDNGVLGRQGHTEGSVDLMRLAGFKPAAVLSEVMNEDGTIAKGKQLIEFAKKHQITLLSIEDLVTYRLCNENLIEEEASANLPLEKFGQFSVTAIREKITGREHVILTNEQITQYPLLVRIHSACITGDLFGSKRCDCHQQLQYALQRMSEEGGMLIYLSQEGRGVGIVNKIKAYALQEQGMDTIEANHDLGFPADLRHYYIAAHVLHNREIERIRLLTSNPDKINHLRMSGIKDVIQETMPVFCNEYNKNYLQIKKEKLNHIFAADFLLS